MSDTNKNELLNGLLLGVICISIVTLFGLMLSGHGFLVPGLASIGVLCFLLGPWMLAYGEPRRDAFIFFSIGVMMMSGAFFLDIFNKQNQQKSLEQSPATPTANPAPTEFDAYYFSTEKVKTLLKAPSTAKFSAMHESKIKRKGAGFEVLGYVDAQNSFGAMVRQSWLCNIEFPGENKYIAQCEVN